MIRIIALAFFACCVAGGPIVGRKGYLITQVQDENPFLTTDGVDLSQNYVVPPGISGIPNSTLPTERNLPEPPNVSTVEEVTNNASVRNVTNVADSTPMEGESVNATFEDDYDDYYYYSSSPVLYDLDNDGDEPENEDEHAFDNVVMKHEKVAERKVDNDEMVTNSVFSSLTYALAFLFGNLVCLCLVFMAFKTLLYWKMNNRNYQVFNDRGTSKKHATELILNKP